VILSVLGLIAAVWLAMCLGQAAVARIALPQADGAQFPVPRRAGGRATDDS